LIATTMAAIHETARSNVFERGLQWALRGEVRHDVLEFTYFRG